MALTPYWQEQTGGFTRGLGNLEQAILQAPAMRAMAAQRQQAAQLRDAQTQEAMARLPLLDAQTRETGAKATDIETQTAGRKQEMDANDLVTKAFADASADPQNPQKQSALISAMGYQAWKHPDQSAKAFGNLAAVFQQLGGSKDVRGMGVLQGGAASIANNDSRVAAESKLMTVAPGAALVDKLTGDRKWQNPSAAAAGENTETTVEEIPAVDPVAAVPPTTSHLFGLFGKDSPGSPAIPGTPAKKITRKVALPPPGSVPAAPAAPAAPATAGKVRVQHPNGSFGYIPAEQLPDALSQGFKQAPAQ